LAKIAGHSSILITQRYCHPQSDAIERAFASAGNQRRVTEDGHQENETAKEKKEEPTKAA
jgi:heat shock protein HslJ